MRSQSYVAIAILERKHCGKEMTEYKSRPVFECVSEVSLYFLGFSASSPDRVRMTRVVFMGRDLKFLNLIFNQKSDNKIYCYLFFPYSLFYLILRYLLFC